MTADAVGGVWQYSVQLARLLAERSVRVVIATMGPQPTGAQREFVERIPGVSLCSSSFALEWMPNPWHDVDRAGEWLLAIESAFRPDVVHLNGYSHANLAWQAPTLVVAHSCVCSWWEAVHGRQPPREWDEYAARVAAGLRAARALAAPTQSMADVLSRLYGVTREVRVIANSCDPTQWSPRPKEPFVLTAGRAWDAAKNVRALDIAAPAVEWPIYIAGDRISPDGATTAFSNLNVLGALEPHGMAEWMGRAAIYALPARYEPFGLSVLEAAHSRCALVLGDTPSLRENWSGVAHFVHPDRPDELQRTLRDLIADHERRDAFGDAALQRARTFTVEKHVTGYERIYQDMVADYGGPAHTTRTV
jgi:glycogen(starch) synthase